MRKRWSASGKALVESISVPPVIAGSPPSDPVVAQRCHHGHHRGASLAAPRCRRGRRRGRARRSRATSAGWHAPASVGRSGRQAEDVDRTRDAGGSPQRTGRRGCQLGNRSRPCPRTAIGRRDRAGAGGNDDERLREIAAFQRAVQLGELGPLAAITARSAPMATRALRNCAPNCRRSSLVPSTPIAPAAICATCGVARVARRGRLGGRNGRGPCHNL